MTESGLPGADKEMPCQNQVKDIELRVSIRKRGSFKEDEWRIVNIRIRMLILWPASCVLSGSAPASAVIYLVLHTARFGSD